MAVPLDLSITPMRVLQDPTLGPTCRALFDQGGVDDRFLVILFLLVESIRPDSLWKPYDPSFLLVIALFSLYSEVMLIVRASIRETRYYISICHLPFLIIDPKISHFLLLFSPKNSPTTASYCLCGQRH